MPLRVPSVPMTAIVRGKLNEMAPTWLTFFSTLVGVFHERPPGGFLELSTSEIGQLNLTQSLNGLIINNTDTEELFIVLNAQLKQIQLI
jgi:hypothetical protein